MNAPKIARVVTTIIVALFFSTAVWSYGGGGKGGQKSCKKPTFTKRSPEPSAVVSPSAEFSFVASANTKRNSIEVTVKRQKVPIDIGDAKNDRLLVKGRLPENLTSGYARIKIAAKSMSNCPTQDGWLVKIAEQ